MSLPNIDKSREGLYLALLSLQLVAWTAVTTANEIARGEDGVLAGIVSVGESMGQIAVAVAVLTVTVVEGSVMLAERYLRRRYREGKAEGKAEGKVEGKAETLSAVEEAARRQGLGAEEIRRVLDEAREIVRGK